MAEGFFVWLAPAKVWLQQQSRPTLGLITSSGKIIIFAEILATERSSGKVIDL